MVLADERLLRLRLCDPTYAVGIAAATAAAINTKDMIM